MGFLYSLGLMQRTKKGWQTLSVLMSSSRDLLNWLLRVGERFLVSAPCHMEKRRKCQANNRGVFFLFLGCDTNISLLRFPYNCNLSPSGVVKLSNHELGLKHFFNVIYFSREIQVSQVFIILNCDAGVCRWGRWVVPGISLIKVYLRKRAGR